MTYIKIPHIETSSLPSLCSGKKCLADTEAGSAYCKPCGDRIKGKHIRKETMMTHRSPVLGSLEPGWLWIYFIRATEGVKAIKIGYARNVKARLAGLQTSSPVELKLVAAFVAKDLTESFLHEKFGDSRIRGEWFKETESLMKMIDKVSDGTVPDYIPGVLRCSESGNAYTMPIDKQIGK